MKILSDKEYDLLPIKEKLSYTGIIKWPDGHIDHIEDGELHNLNGPAVKNSYGFPSYFIYGKFYAEQDWKRHPEVIMQKIKKSKEFQDLLEYKNL